MPAIEINGRMSDFDVTDDTPLLWVLRDLYGGSRRRRRTLSSVC
jgi:hypothetical protein